MDSMRGHGGIKMLLTAEHEVQQIIYNARNMKLERLKQAKDEAENEAAAFRASLEKEYQRKVSEETGCSGGNVKKLEEETDAKINSLNDASSIIGSDVVSMLLNHVTTVRV